MLENEVIMSRLIICFPFPSTLAPFSNVGRTFQLIFQRRNSEKQTHIFRFIECQRSISAADVAANEAGKRLDGDVGRQLFGIFGLQDSGDDCHSQSVFSLQGIRQRFLRHRHNSRDSESRRQLLDLFRRWIQISRRLLATYEDDGPEELICC